MTRRTPEQGHDRHVTPSVTDEGWDNSVLTPSQVTPSQTMDAVLNNLSLSTPSSLSASIHNIPSDQAFYFACQPPKEPETVVQHTPCDIVLVIDVSGSMMEEASLPDLQPGAAKEETCLSILDLVRHSARSILENLNEHDRLAIVTFSYDAEVIQELIPMTDHNKKMTKSRIEDLKTIGRTNLWSGIRSGLRLFENTDFSNVVQGLFILTDGQPNHMCPEQGYINKMRPMLAGMARAKARVGVTMPTIHTFGFGYDIRSDLMQSIAEIGNGNYAFIPEAGMIGTVFVHAVANLFSTFAVNATLEVETQSKLGLRSGTVFNTERPSDKRTVFHLGNLQYGQSRDIILTYDSCGGRSPAIEAKLSYRDHFGRAVSIRLDPEPSDGSQLAEASYAYHLLRSQLCDHISAFFPLSSSSNEHAAIIPDRDSKQFDMAVRSLRKFIHTISSHPLASDPRIASLIMDLTAPEGEQHGQVSKAIQNNASSKVRGQGNYYWKWGRHYLPSLLHAHARQVCNSFKDPGPLMYGQDSPLFIQCRDQLDAAFENLPAPKPSRRRLGGGGSGPGFRSALPPVKMSRYHSKSNPCFSGGSKVLLVGGSLLAVEKLRPGHQVWTQAGGRKVVAILRTDPLPRPSDPAEDMIDNVGGSSRGVLCKLKDLWVTPWHPVLMDGTWQFPAEVAEEVKVCDEPVYSLLLEQQEQQQQQHGHNGHTVTVGGVVAVTLGHGITRAGAAADANNGDIRAHSFFGDWIRVRAALDGLHADHEGRLRCGGVLRDEKMGGLVHGFQPVAAAAAAPPPAHVEERVTRPLIAKLLVETCC